MFIAMSALCANLSVASFLASGIENKTALWSQAGYLQDEKEWQALYEFNLDSEDGLLLDPRHVQNRTRLLEWRAYMQRLSPDVARESLLQAIEGYRELTDLIPPSGYAWASIGDLRARLGIFDDVTNQALEYAVLLHPVEEQTQRRVIRAGIGYWEKWPEPTRKRVRDTIANALKTDTTLQAQPIDRFVFDTAIDNGWEVELHQLLPDEALRKRFSARRRQR